MHFDQDLNPKDVGPNSLLELQELGKAAQPKFVSLKESKMLPVKDKMVIKQRLIWKSSIFGDSDSEGDNVDNEPDLVESANSIEVDSKETLPMKDDLNKSGYKVGFDINPNDVWIDEAMSNCQRFGTTDLILALVIENSVKMFKNVSALSEELGISNEKFPILIKLWKLISSSLRHGIVDKDIDNGINDSDLESPLLSPVRQDDDDQMSNLLPHF